MGASLVAQQLRICPAMQRTEGRSLAWGDPARLSPCATATEPARPRACASLEKSPRWEPVHSHEDPVQPEEQINKSLFFKKAKRVRLDLKTKHKTYLLSKRNSFLKKDKDRLKIKEQRKIYRANTSHKKAGVKIVSPTIDSKTRGMTRDKRRHFKV